MRRAAEVSSFNLMYTLCMYYEKQKSYDKTELTFQPTLVIESISDPEVFFSMSHIPIVLVDFDTLLHKTQHPIAL